MKKKPGASSGLCGAAVQGEADQLSQGELDALLSGVREVQERLTDVQGATKKVKTTVSEISGVAGQTGDDVVDYLECKQQILLAYCQNLMFYLMLKAHGRSVKDHPVMDQMLELRYVMEKMRPLDAKLQHQIDRLVNLSTSGASSQEFKQALLRPNPAALLGKDDDEDDLDDIDLSSLGF